MSKLGGGARPDHYNKILIPIEGHPSELKMSRLFLDLAKVRNRELTFFHVKTPETKAEKILNRLKNNIMEKEVKAQIRVISGEDPAHEILREAKKQYDLIVMASRIKALKKELFGSVTNRVARGAKCDVVVFHNVNKLPKNLGKILVPLFSPNRKVVKLVLEFLDTEYCRDADVTFLHLHEIPISLPLGTEYIPDEERKRVRKVLSIIKEESKAVGKTPWFKDIITRDIRKTLLDYVKKFKPDLVFIPARTRPRAVFGLLGTDEYYLASHLSVPVILFFSHVKRY